MNADQGKRIERWIRLTRVLLILASILMICGVLFNILKGDWLFVLIGLGCLGFGLWQTARGG